MNMYGIIHIQNNKVVGEYNSTREKYIYPYGSRATYLHFVVETGKHAQGYSLDAQSNLIYDTTYVPASQTYSAIKRNELRTIQDNYNLFLLKFATENSDVLNAEISRKAALYMADNTDVDGLNVSDSAALVTFVRGELDPLADALLAMHNDVKMHYFWRIEAHIAAVPRSPLLASEARLSQLQIDLLAIVRPS